VSIKKSLSQVSRESVQVMRNFLLGASGLGATNQLLSTL
jgi:hypothetical protein